MTSPGMSTQGSVVTSWPMSAIGKSGARSSGRPARGPGMKIGLEGFGQVGHDVEPGPWHLSGGKVPAHEGFLSFRGQVGEATVLKRCVLCRRSFPPAVLEPKFASRRAGTGEGNENAESPLY